MTGSVEYAALERWCKVHELVINRCKVINDVTEDHASVSGRRGRYRLELFGRKVAEWRVYDLRSVEDAYQRADAIYNALWDARREGYATFA